jgi:hypothetical protein
LYPFFINILYHKYQFLSSEIFIIVALNIVIYSYLIRKVVS